MARSITYEVTQIEKSGSFVLSKEDSYIAEDYDFSYSKLLSLFPSNSWYEVDMNVFGSGTINVLNVAAIKVIYVQCSEPLLVRINYQNEILVNGKFVFYGLVEFLEIQNYSEYDNDILVEFSGAYEENSEIYKFQVYNSMSGATFINTGATGLSYIDLPKPKSGVEFNFSVTDADGMQIFAPYDTVITDNVDTTDVGGYIESTTILSTAQITYNTKTSWLTNNTGTWLFSGEGDTGLIQLLGRTTVNLQTLTGQPLYTVPSGKIAIITNIICRGFTANLDKDFTLGFNSSTFNDVLGAPVYAADVLPAAIGSCLILSLSSFSYGSLFDSTVALRIQNHAEGTAADVLTLLMAGANTDPGTMVVDVLGYLVDA